MKGRLEGRVAIVTGGGHGIGKAYAIRLASEGAKIVIAEVDEKAAYAVAKELTGAGYEALGLRTDVSDAASVERMANTTVERFGRIDVLVNNAAIFATVPMSRSPFDQITIDEWDRMMTVNLKGTWLASCAVIPQMRKQGYGKIINISSGASKMPLPAASLYSATKAALDAITISLSKELGAKNVRVNSILPGATETEGATSAGVTAGSEYEKMFIANTPLGRRGQPEDIAKAAVFLASDDAAWITGEQFSVSGGMYGF